MKTIALVYKNLKGNPAALTAWDVFNMATVGGSRALNLPELGTIERGKKADLVFVDLNRARMRPIHNAISHIVYAAKGCDVKSVMVDGSCNRT
jgi:5-methylthioadenosine/S-adenosylhomocysteine deaminase